MTSKPSKISKVAKYFKTKVSKICAYKFEDDVYYCFGACACNSVRVAIIEYAACESYLRSVNRLNSLFN